MPKPLKYIGIALGYVLGVFLILRAIAEPFVINYTDPESYKHDWGGPTLVGVMLVHMLPGLLALVLIGLHLKSVFASKKPSRK